MLQCEYSTLLTQKCHFLCKQESIVLKTTVHFSKVWGKINDGICAQFQTRKPLQIKWETWFWKNTTGNKWGPERQASWWLSRQGLKGMVLIKVKKELRFSCSARDRAGQNCGLPAYLVTGVLWLFWAPCSYWSTAMISHGPSSVQRGTQVSAPHRWL